jgi:2-aminoadipate transaminase
LILIPPVLVLSLPVGNIKSSALSQLGRRTAEPAIAELMNAVLARPHLISLAAGFTDNESLPVARTRQLLEEVLCSPQAQGALQYGTTLGELPLRQLTAERLQKLDGSRGKSGVYAPENLLITHGSQQFLYMLTEALCDPGDIVLVEDPTYFVYLEILISHGIRTHGVRLKETGIDIEHLESVLKRLKRTGEIRRLKYLYLVTYFQNPSGITTSFEKKREALKLLKRFERAAGHPIYLVEDAAYRELRFAGDDVKSFLTLKGSEDRVIYTSTYSKPFATGVRVGFGLMPEPIFKVVARIKGNHDFGTSNLLQQLIARALASGHYDDHLTALRKRYAHKARVMGDALTEHFPMEVKWNTPTGGLNYWARVPANVRTGAKSKLSQLALANDVLYVPGQLCYCNDPDRKRPDNEMRLSYGNASEANIREGIKRLGSVLNKLIH